jgi:RNA polymerase sigma-70 factor (ECF subfamily)
VAELAPRRPEPLDVRGIFEQYYRDVWRLLRRLGVAEADLDDAAQEVFWVAARRLSDINPDSVHPFLYGVALRVASNARRKLAANLTHSFDDDLAVSTTPLADEQLEGAQARQLLAAVLSRMTPSLRSVFVLFELERLELRHIAEIEDIPLGTVNSRLRRAREEFTSLCKRARTTLAREAKR